MIRCQIHPLLHNSTMWKLPPPCCLLWSVHSDCRCLILRFHHCQMPWTIQDVHPQMQCLIPVQRLTRWLRILQVSFQIHPVFFLSFSFVFYQSSVRSDKMHRWYSDIHHSGKHRSADILCSGMCHSDMHCPADILRFVNKNLCSDKNCCTGLRFLHLHVLSADCAGCRYCLHFLPGILNARTNIINIHIQSVR